MGENENIQEEFDKIQQALSRSYAERDKYAGEMDKLREELERVQGAAGKYQIAQEKTQMELDKAHQEIDILREKMERNQGESRRELKTKNTQVQGDKEKLLYELDTLQAELE